MINSYTIDLFGVSEGTSGVSSYLVRLLGLIRIVEVICYKSSFMVSYLEPKFDKVCFHSKMDFTTIPDSCPRNTVLKCQMMNR